MRSNPFGDIEELFGRMGSELPVDFGGPRVDIIDEGEALLVRADLPGYDRDDIDLTLNDRQLTIAATRSVDDVEIEDDENRRVIRRERERHGASRTVRLPEPVDAEDVTAKYDRGVLEVRLPKSEPADGHTIDVE